MEPADRGRTPTAQERADQYRVLLVIGAIGVVAWVIWSTRGALIPFVFGMIIAYVLLPFVNFIENLMPDRGVLHHVRRTIAVVIVYLVALGILVAGFVATGPRIIQESNELIESLPDYVETVRKESDYWNERYVEDVPKEWRDQIESNLDELGSSITSAVRSGILATIGTMRRFLGVVLGFAILPLWVFYVLKDHNRGSTIFYRMWPAYLRTDVRSVVRIVDYVLGRYIRGQLFLGLVVGLVSGIGFWVLEVQQPLALGVVAGILEMVPILGPWITFFVAALVVLATDPEKIIHVAVLSLMVQQLENTFLVPRVQGTAVSMNPAVIMMLLVIGGSIGGIFGIIAIVPIAAVARDVFLYIHGRLDGRIVIDEQTGLPTKGSPPGLPLESHTPDQ